MLGIKSLNNVLFVKHIKFWTDSYYSFSVSCAQVIKNIEEFPAVKMEFLSLNQTVIQNVNVTEIRAAVRIYDRCFHLPCN